MAATILITASIAALVVLAVRHVMKHGSCAECSGKTESKGGSGCSGHCGSCPYCASEKEHETAAKP
ncbi:MAG: hypothetical protein LKE53_08225 [Oscillospiraceae bacterium]|jgi:tRNA(Ile2) C34 agmatinyltransferase TiaS|nr:hypothetical protein [Oscillospiraceae bacterium]